MAEQHSTALSSRCKDLTGKRFGRRVALRYAGKDKRRNSLWTFRCDCGKHGIVLGYTLTRSDIKSCGCLARELLVERTTTHGKTNTPEFCVWQSMIARCYIKSQGHYYFYGGRGIRVCDEWRHSFETFLCDIGKRPSPKHSLDRIDTNGNYQVDNCKWSTATEQNRNTRRNRRITFRGETRCLSEWVEILGLNYRTLASRLKAGWDLERAMTQPVQQRRC